MRVARVRLQQYDMHGLVINFTDHFSGRVEQSVGGVCLSVFLCVFVLGTLLSSEMR